MDKKNTATDRPISLHYIFKSNVSSYQNLGNGTCQVGLSAGWNLIHTTIGSISLQESTEEPAAGTLHKTRLQAKHPGHETETPQQIADLSGRRVMLKITYRSGKKKIIGNAISCPKLFIRTQSDISTTLTIDCNFESTNPNLFLAE
jgi:hypothetical protein